MYGGSYDTINPSFELGGSQGKLNYFVDGSYNNNDLGIENPTSSQTAIHDNTEQYKSFAYLSYILDDTSRVSVMVSASYSNFEIPNTPGLPAGTAPDGSTRGILQAAVPATFNSSSLNEQQLEQNYYGVVTYQKSAGNLNYQVSAFGRNSSVHFTPDPTGDLYFNGVASDVQQEHLLRRIAGGRQFGNQRQAHAARRPDHAARKRVPGHHDDRFHRGWQPAIRPAPPFPSTANNSNYGVFGGIYLQDEWKITDQAHRQLRRTLRRF